MILNKKKIDEGLKCYGIDDAFYKEKCYECIEFLDNNENVMKKVKELYDIVYFNKDDIELLWKKKNVIELFGEIYHPFITNIILLLGYDIHISNIKKYNLDEEQISIHKKRVKETLTDDIFLKNMNGIRISQMLWGIYFINLRLIEVGRLQYELVFSNPLDEKKKEKCIKIHIPGGSKLEIEEVKRSIEKSKSEIKKYFGLDKTKYYCSSWLLSKQIRSVIDDSSNIAKFYELFDVTEQDECIDDILKFLFRSFECNDFNTLIENTSLQRSVKNLLIEGKTIKLGTGILKDINN